MGSDVATGEAPARALLLEKLRDLGVRGILVQMAERGQIVELRCETPKCYYQRGRNSFEPKSGDREWWLSVDHYPTLKRDGGHLDPWNVRIAHVMCNRTDDGWRKMIRTMLENRKSLEEISETLNHRGVRRPHGTSKWSAAFVRKEFVS